MEKQDIRNISSSFDINKIQRHFNDQDSVLSWIREWENSQENPILYYKMQGIMINFI